MVKGRITFKSNQVTRVRQFSYKPGDPHVASGVICLPPRYVYYNVTISEKDITVETLYPSSMKTTPGFHRSVITTGMRGKLQREATSEKLFKKESEVVRLLQMTMLWPSYYEMAEEWIYDIVKVVENGQ